MKVLVIGNGGREHALVWKLKQSKKVTGIFVAPGNPGTAQIAENINISATAINELVDFCKQEKIDLVVVGPEQPLELGLVDALENAGINVFGPSKAAAQLECSKSFAKSVMQAAGVPTARHHVFYDCKLAEEYLVQQQLPIVIKADGLAAGKGVYVCTQMSEAKQALVELYEQETNRKVVIEEFLQGKEASLIVACAGTRVVELAAAHDYKRIFDNDQGPNTGGMGTVSPTPNLTKAQYDWAVANVIKPVLEKMQENGQSFKGFLYAGLMIAPNDSINVLEFNCRLGDPETQVILTRLESDLFELLYSLTTSQELPTPTWSNEASVCVVLASKGYPQSSSNGDVITGIGAAEQAGAFVFQAGTGYDNNGNLVTKGGRVLNVVARGSNIEAARCAVYQAAQFIKFDGMQYRKDIAS